MKKYYIDKNTDNVKIYKGNIDNAYKEFIFDNLNLAVNYKKTVYKTTFDDLGHSKNPDERIIVLQNKKKHLKNVVERFNLLKKEFNIIDFFSSDDWIELDKVNKEWEDNTNNYKAKKYLYKETLANWLTQKTGKVFTPASRDIEKSITGNTVLQLSKLSGYNEMLENFIPVINEYNKKDKAIVDKYKLLLSDNTNKNILILINLYSEIRKLEIECKALENSILIDCLYYKDIKLLDKDNFGNIVYSDYFKSYNIYVMNDNRLSQISYIYKDKDDDRYIFLDYLGRVYPNQCDYYIDFSMTGSSTPLKNSIPIKTFDLSNDVAIYK